MRGLKGIAACHPSVVECKGRARDNGGIAEVDVVASMVSGKDKLLGGMLSPNTLERVNHT